MIALVPNFGPALLICITLLAGTPPREVGFGIINEHEWRFRLYTQGGRLAATGDFALLDYVLRRLDVTWKPRACPSAD